jgi:hypothetical protein
MRSLCEFVHLFLRNYNGYDDLSPQHADQDELDEQARRLEQLSFNDYQQQQQQQQQEEEGKYSFGQYDPVEGNQEGEESQFAEQQHQHDSCPHHDIDDLYVPAEGETAAAHHHSPHDDDDDDRAEQPAVPEDPYQPQDQLQGHYDEEEQYQYQEQPQEERGEGEEVNDLEALQLQREREFMAYLCDGLEEQVPAEYAQHIEADLSERLRQTVSDVVCSYVCDS